MVVRVLMLNVFIVVRDIYFFIYKFLVICMELNLFDWVLEIDKIDLMEWKCFGIVISLVI